MSVRDAERPRDSPDRVRNPTAAVDRARGRRRRQLRRWSGDADVLWPGYGRTGRVSGSRAISAAAAEPMMPAAPTPSTVSLRGGVGCLSAGKISIWVQGGEIAEAAGGGGRYRPCECRCQVMKASSRPRQPSGQPGPTFSGVRAAGVRRRLLQAGVCCRGVLRPRRQRAPRNDGRRGRLVCTPAATSP